MMLAVVWLVVPLRLLRDRRCMVRVDELMDGSLRIDSERFRPQQRRIAFFRSFVRRRNAFPLPGSTKQRRLTLWVHPSMQHAEESLARGFSSYGWIKIVARWPAVLVRPSTTMDGRDDER